MLKKISVVFLLLMVLTLSACVNPADKNPPENKVFTITYNVDGGSPVASVEIDKGGVLGTLPITTKDGFTFNGWFTDSEKTIEATANTIVTSNMTLYAKWTEDQVVIEKYTITYNVDGGSPVASVEIDKGGVLGTLPITTKDGFTFNGWFTDSEKTIEATANTIVTSNMTLYAKWTEDQVVIEKYTITYNVDGGSPVASVEIDKDGVLGTLPITTKDGFTFNGWFTDSEKTIDATANTIVTSNMTLYAKWTEDQVVIEKYTITYNVDGGSPVASVEIDKDGVLGTLPITTKDGFTFNGWFTDSEKTIEATANTIVTSNMTLYAKWTEDQVVIEKFTITYNVDGGSPVASVDIDKDGVLGTLPITTKDGFTFNGWFTDSEKTIEATANTIVTSNMTLYAKWTEDLEEYIIVFDSKGGSSVDSITVLEGTSTDKPANPTLDGYSFVAWTYDEEGNEVVEWPLVLTSDLTLFANWNESVPIKTYLSTLLDNYGVQVDNVLPEKLQTGGKLHNEHDFALDYNNFVSTSDIVFGGYGEQWQMFLNNLEQAQIFFNVLNIVDMVSASSVVVFNNYLDNNPHSVASHTYNEGIYTIGIDFRDNVLVYLIDYLGTIPLIGEVNIQIALILDVETGEKSGRIQLGEIGTLKYTIIDNGFIISSTYGTTVNEIPFRRHSYIEVLTDESEITNGSLFEFTTLGSFNTNSAAQFTIDDTYASIIGNKASGEIALVGTIVELYDIETGKLLAYEVKEKRSLLEFDTIWLNLDDTEGIDYIKGIKKDGVPEPGNNTHELYLNNQASIFETKNVSFINISRRYDIEFRTQYFYKQVGESIEKFSVQVPMLFVQESQLSNLIDDIKDENPYLNNFNVKISSSILTQLQQNYDDYLPIFEHNKENITASDIETYLGVKYVIIE